MGTTRTGRGTPMSDRETIEAEEARELIASSEGVLVLDLRSEEEFGEGHVPGARNVPDADAESLPDDLPEEGKVLLYGSDDDFAAALEERGLEVVELAKGIEGWRDEKLPEQPSVDFERSEGDAEEEDDEGEEPPKLPGAGT